MARTSTTPFAVLGVLAIADASGYEIKQFIDQSLASFWRESYGQLYPTLEQLADDGLVRPRVEPRGRGSRTVWSITPAGREALRGWLQRPLPSSPARNPLLLKLFFGRAVPTAVLEELVREARAECEQQLALLRALEQQLTEQERDDPHLPYWLMTVRHGVFAAQASLAWCDETLTSLHALPRTPGDEHQPDPGEDSP